LWSKHRQLKGILTSPYNEESIDPFGFVGVFYLEIMIEKLKLLSESFSLRINYAEEKLKEINYDEYHPFYLVWLTHYECYLYAKRDLDGIINEI